MAMLLRRYHQDEPKPKRGKASKAKPDAKPDAFDPAEHTVAEVNEYLSDADEAEQIRVLDAEAAGQGRTTIKAPDAEIPEVESGDDK